MATTQPQGGQQQPMMAQTQATMMGPQPTTMIAEQQRGSCRNHATIVAWVDIALGIINIGCHLIVFYLANKLAQHINDNQRQEVPPVVWAASYLSIFGVFVSGVEIRIAICLLTSTEIDSLRILAIRRAKTWRGYHIFLIIFSLLVGGVNMVGVVEEGYYVGGYHFVSFVIRCLFIYIVHRFIQELHRVGGGAAPMAMATGNATTTISPSQYQQYPSQYQQQYPSQYQMQPQQFQQL